jgi:hypothetical protein
MNFTPVRCVAQSDGTTQFRTCLYAWPWHPIRHFGAPTLDDLLDQLFAWLGEHAEGPPF